MVTSATIKKMGDKFIIMSKKGKKLGTFDSLKSAKKRLRQIEFFKNQNALLHKI